MTQRPPPPLSGAFRALRSPPFLLAALVLLFFSPVVVAGRAFFLKDVQLVVYPIRLALRQRLLALDVPHWLPELDMGMPFIGNPSHGVLYPLNALLLLPAPWCVGLFVVGHSVLAAVGAFYLLRSLRVSAAAGAMGALSFACGGYMVSLTWVSNYMMSLAWLPLVAHFAVRTLRRGRLGDAALTGLFWALQISSGEPQGVVLTAWLLIALGFSIPTSWGRRARGGALLALAFALAVCVAMPQILPAGELLPRSRRAEGIGLVEASHWSLHPLRLLELLVPWLFGNPLHFDRYLGFFMDDEGSGIHRDPWIVSPYVGSLSLLLAGVAVVRPRARHASWTRGLAVLFVLTLGLALGRHTPIFGLYFDAVPGARLFRYPAKFFGLCAALLPMLAAAGADAWLDKPELSWRRAAALAALPLGLLTGLSFAHLAGPSLERLRPEAKALEATATLRAAFGSELAVFVGGVVVLAWIYRARRSWLSAALPLVVVTQVLRGTVGAYETVPGEVYGEPALARELRSKTPSGEVVRVMQDTDALYVSGVDSAASVERARAFTSNLMMNIGIAFGIGYARAYVSSEEGPKFEFWRRAGPFRRRFLDVFGIRYLVVPSSIDLTSEPGLRELTGHGSAGARVFENRTALPFAYAVPAVTAVDSLEQAMMSVRDPRVARGLLAVADREGGPAADYAAADRAPAGRCQLAAPLGDTIDLTCTLDRPGFVVVNASHHPNWSARVAGEPVAITRTNALVMGIPVAAGRRHVRFEYSEPSLPTGVVVSLAALAIAFLLVRRDLRDEP